MLSIRDLLREIVTHHERVIRDMDVERMTMMSGRLVLLNPQRAEFSLDLVAPDRP